MISRRTALGALAAATATGATLPVRASAPGGRAGGTPAPQAGAEAGKPAVSYKFRLQKAKPREYDGGNIREHRAGDFPVSHTIAGAVVKLEPGAYREPHWHPNSDEWAYILEGKVQLTVVAPHGETTVEEFEYGDVWFVPVGFGHAVVNLAEGDSQILLVHNNGEFTTIELTEWVNGGPKDVFAAALGAPEASLDKVPTKKLFIARKKRKK